jgi:hypothetical protein
MHESIRIVLYALVAAASPTALLATLAVLSSKRRRLNGILFMGGFLFAQALTFVVAYLLGSTVNNTARPIVSTWVELALGVAVLVLCLTRPELRKPRASQTSPRTTALLEKLREVTPGFSLGIGALLGVGGKRLVITIIAAGTLSLSQPSQTSALWLWLLYVIVATLIVWAPVVYSAVFGRRAEDLVTRVQARTKTSGNHHTSIVGIVVGALLVADALVRLLA